MQVDPRVEEAFQLLHHPGGPTPDQHRRARELMREWLHDEELADTTESDEDAQDGDTWQDAAPAELLGQRTMRPAGRQR